MHRDADLFGNAQPAVYSHHCTKYYQHGKLHRSTDSFGNDQPAICNISGGTVYYYKGKKHRNNDKPAEIFDDGTQIWYQNGKLCRNGDKPTVIRADGTLEYYKNGKYHRDDDQPAFIGGRHRKIAYYKNGVLCRDSNPLFEQLPVEIYFDRRVIFVEKSSTEKLFLKTTCTHELFAKYMNMCEQEEYIMKLFTRFRPK